MTSRVMLILAVAPLATSDALAEVKLPKPLEQALAMRFAMKTGHMRYRLVMTGPPSAAVSMDSDRFIETRVAGRAYWAMNHGDEDGFMWRDQDGQPSMGKPYLCSPPAAVVTEDGQIWSHIRDSTFAAKGGNGPLLSDVRCIGLECFPSSRSYETIRADIEERFSDGALPREKREGNLIEVRIGRHFEKGLLPERQMEFVWQIDPSKNHAIISYEVTMTPAKEKPRIWGRAETEYVQLDGYWFPNKSTLWQSSGNEGGVLRCEYELLAVEFDKPNHPRQIDVGMLQIPAGAWVGGPDVNGTHCWDGVNPVPFKDWRAFQRATGQRPIRDLLERNQKADQFRYPAWWYDETGENGIEDVATRPDAWEAYVRRWCIRHDADDKQRTAARGVLDDCRKEARAVLDKRRPELTKLEASLQDAQPDSPEARAALAERDRLLRPVGEIFARLKSRLQPLLRQEQVSDRAATTQPVAPPARPPRPPSHRGR